MKIVRIIARLNVGGPTRHVVWLTEGLQTKDFNSTLITGTVPDGEEDMSYFAREYNIEPIFIPEMSRELSPKDVISLWKVYRELTRIKPDVIHTHTAKAGTIGRIAGFFYRWLNFKKVKIVHTYHGHVFHSYYGRAKTNFFLFIEKFLAYFATDKIIVITPQQFNEIHKDFKVGKEKQFEVIPLGIELESFQNWREKRDLLRREIGADKEEILVGLVGRLTEIKNHLLFLETAKIYQEQKETEFKLRFVIIGDGHLRKLLEQRVEELGIKNIVTFLGNRNDADIFYPGLDIVALTSLNEGTPLSLIEAMANSRAVISTAVGGVVDLLGETETKIENFLVCAHGIQVATNNAEDFYNGLIYLAKNEELRNNMAIRGEKFVWTNYSKDILISNIGNLYRRITKEKDD